MEGVYMIKEIVKDTFILSRPSTPATREDLQTAKDLIDTLEAHKDVCAGMAANMIGVNKRIIIFQEDGKFTVMMNPELMKTTGKYHTSEGCLSLDGTRETDRYESIKVRYYDMDLKVKIKTYKGFTAQVIQHEMDHLGGILI